MIKTTGKEKDYELIEYILNVNTQYTQVLMELNENGAMDAVYTYGVSRLTEDRFTGESNFYLYDPSGNVAGITDQNGYLWQSYRYDAFGNATFGSPQYDNEYTFNAESYNPNIQSQYLRARYYDMVKGNFLTEDSYLGDIRNPLTLNRYSYCIGNPLFYVDPSGHEINPFVASALAGNEKAIEVKNQLISQGDKWADGVTQKRQENLNQFMDNTYDWFGEHTVRKNNVITGQVNNNITAGVAGSFYSTADMITSPEYLAARAYNVAAHPLQTLDRINVNGADVLNGVMGIADKIRNKEYGALARGGGYAAGSVAQVYLLGKGIEKCGDLIDNKKQETLLSNSPVIGKGAYNGNLSTGKGLGKLEGLEIKVTDEGLDIVKKHITENGFEAYENTAMIQRLTDSMNAGQKVSGADASYYMHELREATFMKDGMLYESAHSAALEYYNVSPFSVYHPDVIKIDPSAWGRPWFEFWGIGR